MTAILIMLAGAVVIWTRRSVPSASGQWVEEGTMAYVDAYAQGFQK